eukprot:SAG11_NODE_7699_length_1108_cov_1.543112_2_plen_107_part_01
MVGDEATALVAPTRVAAIQQPASRESNASQIDRAGAKTTGAAQSDSPSFGGAGQVLLEMGFSKPQVDQAFRTIAGRAGAVGPQQQLVEAAIELIIRSGAADRQPCPQ